MVAEPVERLFTVEEYECMIQADVFDPDERIELVGGKILTMAPMNGPHRVCVVRFDYAFKDRLPRSTRVYVQLPVRLVPHDEPEPDIAVVWHRDDDYLAQIHPGPGDILLLVEISDSSVRFDRDQKLPRYALTSIPEVWIADLPSDRIWIYRAPVGGRYEEVTSVGRGETLSLLAFPEIVFAVADLLPPVIE